MSEKLKVGQISNDLADVGRRDAFHVPGVLVTCGQHLRGGDWVRFTDADCQRVELTMRGDAEALVDPFLKDINPGQGFWVFVVPELVGTLVHHFEITGKKDQAKDQLEKVTLERDVLKRELAEALENDRYDDGCGGCYN